MEHVVRQLRFRFFHRGRVVEAEGRTVESADGRVKIQAWVRSAEDPNQLLEVAPVPKLEEAWRLFHKLGAHAGFEPREYRVIGDDGSFGEWKPVPN
jgi:hypothetical protein